MAKISGAFRFTLSTSIYINHTIGRYEVNFTSNGEQFNAIELAHDDSFYALIYHGSSSVMVGRSANEGERSFTINEAYRLIDFGEEQEIDDVLYRFIDDNAVFMPHILGKWKWNETIVYDSDVNKGFDFNFTFNGEQFSEVSFRWKDDGCCHFMYGDDKEVGKSEIQDVSSVKVNEEYRIIDLGEKQIISSYCYDFIVANAQPYIDISERLITIAENQLKVYGAGYTEGIKEGYEIYGEPNITPSDVSLFNFTELEDGTYSIAAKNVRELTGHIVLPYKYNGKLVTEITRGGFASHDDNNHITAVTALTIPRTIRAINNTAFARFDVDEIVIPGSCKKIGTTAFYASRMQRLVLEEGVEEIGANAFSNCSDIGQCVIPSTITETYGDSFAGPGQPKDVYYGGTQTQFNEKTIKVHRTISGYPTVSIEPIKKALADLIWLANVYYNYGNDEAVSKATTANETAIKEHTSMLENHSVNISNNTVAIEAMRTAISKGMTIKEKILWSGDKFYIHPNSFYITMPPSKKLAIYYGDGRADDPYEDEAGIVVGVNSDINANDGKFRSATIIQTAGSILSSGGTAIYAYFFDNANEVNGETGAYLQWNGASDTYCPILYSTSIDITEGGT